LLEGEWIDSVATVRKANGTIFGLQFRLRRQYWSVARNENFDEYGEASGDREPTNDWVIGSTKRVMNGEHGEL